MGRISGIYLSSGQRRQLQNFAKKTKNKIEFRAAQGVLLRSAGKPAEEVARQFDVTIKQVFVWTRKFRTYGAEGLRVKKQTGRPAKKAELAKPRIEELIDNDPQLFGYLKGRWVLRDISRQLKKENINVHYSSVHRILGDMGIKLKSPKLRAPGSIKKNYRKRAEIKRYKRIAPALLKKRYLSASKMKNGQSFYPKPSVAGLKKERPAISQHLVIQRE
ncbi:helix-turn-helix domain-containing protein [Candidatus Woesearchaeota archaeon]|nr:helix-turn-helix domain-containing protein [Candidatus Woesearchaeota archaeon]